jgi:hypothetical protein
MVAATLYNELKPSSMHTKKKKKKRKKKEEYFERHNLMKKVISNSKNYTCSSKDYMPHALIFISSLKQMQSESCMLPKKLLLKSNKMAWQ